MRGCHDTVGSSFCHRSLLHQLCSVLTKTSLDTLYACIPPIVCLVSLSPFVVRFVGWHDILSYVILRGLVKVFIPLPRRVTLDLARWRVRGCHDLVRSSFRRRSLEHRLCSVLHWLVVLAFFTTGGGFVLFDQTTTSSTNQVVDQHPIEIFFFHRKNSAVY